MAKKAIEAKSIALMVGKFQDKLAIILEDAFKFDQGNNAAGGRVRKGLQEIKKGIKDVRDAVTEVKHSR